MGKPWKQWQTLFLGGSKISADSNCSHEIRRHLLLGRKAMRNLDSILKSRDITLPTKVHLVKAMVVRVFMYRCESWTIKKAEPWRIDALELWCWRRLLGVPRTARRSNQSIPRKLVLNIHWKDWCWSWNSNHLATWCEDLTHWKRPIEASVSPKNFCRVNIFPGSYVKSVQLVTTTCPFSTFMDM